MNEDSQDKPEVSSIAPSEIPDLPASSGAVPEVQAEKRRDQARPTVRKLLNGSHRNPEQFAAFILDRFTDVYRNSTTGTTRDTQTTDLLSRKNPEDVAHALRKSNPAEFFELVEQLQSDEQTSLRSLLAEQLRDPTQPLILGSPPPTSSFSEPQLNELCSSLQSNHVLLLSSHDTFCLREAVTLLAGHQAFRGTAPRRLDLDRDSEVPLALDWLAASVQPTAQTHTGGVLIVIDALDTARTLTRDFLHLSHRTLGREAARDSLKTELKKRRCYVLILSEGEPDRIETSIPPPFLHCISGLGAVLRRRGADEARAAAFLGRLKVQSARLGFKEDKLCQSLACLPSIEAIEEKLTHIERTGKTPELPSVHEATAVTLVENADVLKRAILYVAAFLPGLSLDDFQLALFALLAEQSSLRDAWKERRAQIFRECQLRAVPSESDNGERVVRFTDAELHAAVSQALQEFDPFLHDEILQLVRSTGLLFLGSRRLGQRVIDLVVVRLTAEPGRVDVDWLLGLLRHLGPAVPEVEPEDVRQTRLLQLLRENRQLVLERLTSLLVAFQSESQSADVLRKLSRRFLDRLVELKLDDYAVELWRRLYRRNRQLDVTWLRQLLCTGSEQGKQRAERTLFLMLCGQERMEAAGEALVALLTWINESPTEVSALGKRLAFILHIWLRSFVTSSRKAEKAAQRAPSALEWLISNEENQAEVMQELAAALVHPCHLEVSDPRWPIQMLEVVNFWLVSDELHSLCQDDEDSERLEQPLTIEWLQMAYDPVVPRAQAQPGDNLLPHLFQTLIVCAIYDVLARSAMQSSESIKPAKLAERLVSELSRAAERTAPHAIRRMISYVALLQRMVIDLLGALNRAPIRSEQRPLFISERTRLKDLHTHLGAVRQILKSVPTTSDASSKRPSM